MGGVTFYQKSQSFCNQVNTKKYQRATKTFFSFVALFATR